MAWKETFQQMLNPGGGMAGLAGDPNPWAEWAARYRRGYAIDVAGGAYQAAQTAGAPTPTGGATTASYPSYPPNPETTIANAYAQFTPSPYAIGPSYGGSTVNYQKAISDSPPENKQYAQWILDAYRTDLGREADEPGYFAHLNRAISERPQSYEEVRSWINESTEGTQYWSKRMAEMEYGPQKEAMERGYARLLQQLGYQQAQSFEQYGWSADQAALTNQRALEEIGRSFQTGAKYLENYLGSKGTFRSGITLEKVGELQQNTALSTQKQMQGYEDSMRSLGRTLMLQQGNIEQQKTLSTRELADRLIELEKAKALGYEKLVSARTDWATGQQQARWQQQFQEDQFNWQKQMDVLGLMGGGGGYGGGYGGGGGGGGGAADQGLVAKLLEVASSAPNPQAFTDWMGKNRNEIVAAMGGDPANFNNLLQVILGSPGTSWSGNQNWEMDYDPETGLPIAGTEHYNPTQQLQSTQWLSGMAGQGQEWGKAYGLSSVLGALTGKGYPGKYFGKSPKKLGWLTLRK